jgi:hypothetical protein
MGSSSIPEELSYSMPLASSNSARSNAAAQPGIDHKSLLRSITAFPHFPILVQENCRQHDPSRETEVARREGGPIM